MVSYNVQLMTSHMVCEQYRMFGVKSQGCMGRKVLLTLGTHNLAQVAIS